MTEKQIYPSMNRELSTQRAQLAPQADEAFRAFSAAVFAEGALSVKMKQLIAVAAAHITQCPYCIRGHTKAALNSGASREEIMESIWVASEMRAGAAYAHSALALDAMGESSQRSASNEKASAA